MSGPSFTRKGSRLIYTWPGCVPMSEMPSQGISLTFDRLRDTNQYGVQAEVSVDYSERMNGRVGHIAYDHVRLGSIDKRAEFVKRLPDLKLGWKLMVDEACRLAIEEVRRNDPRVNLGKVVVPPGPPPYLLKHLVLEQDVNMVFADGGAGKSLLAMAICGALESGAGLPSDLQPTRTAKTFYFDWETSQLTHARRLDRIARGLGLSSRPEVEYCRMSRPLAESANLVADLVYDSRAEFVVVDSVGYAVSSELKEAEAARDLYNCLRALDVTPLVVHHVTKAEARSDARATPYGTAYLRNGARNCWELRSRVIDDRTLAVALWHDKLNDGPLEKQPRGLKVTFDELGEVITFDAYDVGSDPELRRHGGLRYELETILRHGAKTIKEMAAETGGKQDTIGKLLRRRRDLFRVVKPGRKGAGGDTLYGLAAHYPDLDDVAEDGDDEEPEGEDRF